MGLQTCQTMGLASCSSGLLERRAFLFAALPELRAGSGSLHGLHGEPNEHFPVLQARLMQLLRDIAQAFTERPQGTPTP